MWRLVVVVTLGGCLHADQLVCGDKVCPTDRICVPALAQCHTQEELDGCIGLVDGDACQVGAKSGTCISSVCLAPVCGDGIITTPEECDGDNLGGMTCQDLGYYDASPLSCTSRCQFDTSACIGTCGDGARNGGELCDGADLGGKTCTDYGFYEADGLACLPVCLHDTSQCRGFCGDGVRNGPELCDGAPPNVDCLGFGYDLGAVTCGASCAANLATCRRVDWKAESVPASAGMRGVWQAPTGEVFAVGLGALADVGTGWRPMQAPVQLWAVTGRSATDVYAVGDGGSLLHYDGNPQLQWVLVTGVPLTTSLRGIFLRGAEIFVVGTGGTSAHFDGTAWTTMSGAFYDLHGVWGTADTMYAVGDFGVFTYDGTVPDTWAMAGGPTLALGITGWSDSDYFVWTASGAYHATGGGTFTPLGMPPGGFDAMVAAYSPAPGELIAAAEYTAFQSLLFHHDGTTWAAQAIDDPYTSPRFLRAIHGRGPGDLITIGLAERAFRYQGLAWDANAQSTTLKPSAVCAARRNTVVTVTGSQLKLWNGTAWSTAASATALQAELWCGGTTVVSVGANGTIMRSSNSGTSFTPESAGGSTAAYTAVVGRSATDIYVGGAGGVFAHYDGAWQLLSSAPGAISRLWASPTSVYAVIGGNLYQYTGTWSSVSGAPNAIQEIWGTADDNYVIVRGGGGVFRHTASGFAAETQLPTTQVVAIAGASASKIIAAGVDVIMMFDGTTWSQMRSPTFAGIADVWVTDNLLLVGGFGGTFLMNATAP